MTVKSFAERLTKTVAKTAETGYNSITGLQTEFQILCSGAYQTRISAKLRFWKGNFREAKALIIMMKYALTNVHILNGHRDMTAVSGKAVIVVCFENFCYIKASAG